MTGAALLLGLIFEVSGPPRPATPDLASAVAAAAGTKGPVWIAWEVPVANPDSHSCCYSTLDSFDRGARMTGRCVLEGDRSWTMSNGGENGNALVDPDEHRMLVVLVRMEDGKVVRVRSVSEDCPVDTGSVPARLLTGVKPAESVAFLASLARRGTGGKKEGVLAALASHADPAAIPALIDLARHDASDHVRGQSLFWLAQRAGRKAVGAITDAIANDPETEVKVRAVFALSQLPKDEGVPLLIDLARRNRNPAVRKKAMFWLGQSKDPRALAFIEEVLLK
ncbi:MAG TPA: HEAT repeat domain-containing protein [Thermoanaerobaculia bacterium]|nr:HEAT repeat domain-containing protein [Thermoanaerobaculia bacterium]